MLLYQLFYTLLQDQGIGNYFLEDKGLGNGMPIIFRSYWFSIQMLKE